MPNWLPNPLSFGPILLLHHLCWHLMLPAPSSPQIIQNLKTTPRNSFSQFNCLYNPSPWGDLVFNLFLMIDHPLNSLLFASKTFWPSVVYLSWVDTVDDVYICPNSVQLQTGSAFRHSVCAVQYIACRCCVTPPSFLHRWVRTLFFFKSTQEWWTFRTPTYLDLQGVSNEDPLE